MRFSSDMCGTVRITNERLESVLYSFFRCCGPCGVSVLTDWLQSLIVRRARAFWPVLVTPGYTIDGLYSNYDTANFGPLGLPVTRGDTRSAYLHYIRLLCNIMYIIVSWARINELY